MQNGQRLQALINNMPNGFAHNRLIYKGGIAVDWVHLVVNDAYQKQTGLKEVVGKRASEILPGVHERNPDLLKIYSQVAESGQPEVFETFIERLNQWFNVSAYTTEPETFTLIFENITRRKQTENLLAYKNKQVAESYEDLVESWSAAMDIRDANTSGHSKRLAKSTLRLMDAMGYVPHYMEKINMGAMLHDIGKILIPDSVLLKPGPLTDEEWKVMRRHPGYAWEILKDVEYLRDVIKIPRDHHERWNGSGYPRGLQGVDIPLEVRVFSVVDVFDALTNDRPYRRALSTEAALAHLNQEADVLYDPMVVKAFTQQLDLLIR